MVGTKKKAGRKYANWGGKRAGAGLPTKEQPTLDAKTKKALIKAGKDLAKEHGGETIEKAVLKLVYDEGVDAKVKKDILKVWVDSFLTKESKQTISKTVKEEGPAIGLPPIEEDPALKVVKGGK